MNAVRLVGGAISIALVAGGGCGPSPEDHFCPRIAEFYMDLDESEIDWIESRLSPDARRAFLDVTVECSGYF
jgi:hypothetical protein